MSNFLQLVLLSIILFSCSTNTTNFEKDEANQSIIHAVTEIQIQKARQKPFLYYINTKGKLAPKNESTIYPKSIGILTAIKVKFGYRK